MPAKKQEAPEAKQLTVTLPTLSFKIDDNFKTKLPMLVLILLLFSFACFLFGKANFKSTELVDLSRIKYSLPKLYSVMFLAFIIVFSLVLALCIYYGFGISKPLTLLVFPVTLIPAFVIDLILPGGYSGVFAAFSLTVTAGAFAASFSDKLSLSNIWSVAGKALLVLLVLSFVLTFMKVNAAKAQYNDALLTGVIGLVPDLTGNLATAAQGATISEDTVKSAFKKEDMASLLPPDDIKAALSQVPGMNVSDAQKTLYATMISAAITSDSAYNVAVTKITAAANKMIQTTASQAATGMNAALPLVKGYITKMPMYKQLYDGLPIVLALAVVSLVGILNFFLKIFATIFVFALGKVLG